MHAFHAPFSKPARPAQVVRMPAAWQVELQHSFTRPAALLDYLELTVAPSGVAGQALQEFPLRVPRPYAQRMRKRDPGDPLLRQVWPAAEEELSADGDALDPVCDLHRLHPGGLIRKYQGRALLITSGACGIHCRYCFRRHFPYQDALASKGGWRAALAGITADPTISEVILSGGDPLALSDDKLETLVEGLEAIAHVKRLRIHSRQPVVLPQRVDQRLLGWLASSRLQKVLVLHANHAQELDAAVATACTELGRAGVTLLNQSVLLRQVNDNARTLSDLSEGLLAIKVLPYYLHIMDRVRGSAHFEVDETRARTLMQQLAACLPGYLVPRLVRETPGAPYKQIISW